MDIFKMMVFFDKISDDITTVFNSGICRKIWLKWITILWNIKRSLFSYGIGNGVCLHMKILFKSGCDRHIRFAKMCIVNKSNLTVVQMCNAKVDLLSCHTNLNTGIKPIHTWRYEIAVICNYDFGKAVIAFLLNWKETYFNHPLIEVTFYCCKNFKMVANFEYT